MLLTLHDYFRTAFDKGFKIISAFHMQHADDDDVDDGCKCEYAQTCKL